MCSADDKLALAALGLAGPISAVPNAIPDWCLTATPHQRGPVATPEILFVGHLGYTPNKRAVAYLCKKIMPAVRHLVPDATLHVCGHHPSEKVIAMAGAGQHRLSANPPDLAKIYLGASAVAAPLKQGGGPRIRILEALALGCPIVATAKVVAGLNLVPDHHYLRAEAAHGFSRQLARAVQHPESIAAIVRQGRNLALSGIGPEAILATLSHALLVSPDPPAR